jgi:hypothetical protein
MRRTACVVRQLECRLALGNVDVKDIVVLDAVEQLFATRADGVDHLANLLPRLGGRRPLSEPQDGAVSDERELTMAEDRLSGCAPGAPRRRSSHS